MIVVIERVFKKKGFFSFLLYNNNNKNIIIRHLKKIKIFYDCFKLIFFFYIFALFSFN